MSYPQQVKQDFQVSSLLSIQWDHAVNNRELLDNALADQRTVHFIEVDVRIGLYTGNASSDGIELVDNNHVIACHDGAESDLLLSELIDEVIEYNTNLGIEGDSSFVQKQNTTGLRRASVSSTGSENVVRSIKGIKFDFKMIDAVSPTIQYLKTIDTTHLQHIWLNADIVLGPGGLLNPFFAHPVPAVPFLKGIFLIFCENITFSNASAAIFIAPDWHFEDAARL